MRFVTRHPFATAALVVIAAFMTAAALRSIEADYSIYCKPPYGNDNCTVSRRSAWIDLTAILVVLSGIAGAAAIIVDRGRRRTPSGKSLARVYAICLAITIALYAALVIVVLALT